MSFTPTDIEIFQASFAQFDFLINGDDGEPLNLVNYNIKAQLRTQPGVSGELLAEFEIQDIGLSAGYVRIFLASSATKELPDPVDVPARQYFVGHWDIFAAPSASTATMDRQYLAGRAFIYPRSTQRE